MTDPKKGTFQIRARELLALSLFLAALSSVISDGVFIDSCAFGNSCMSAIAFSAPSQRRGRK